MNRSYLAAHRIICFWIFSFSVIFVSTAQRDFSAIDAHARNSILKGEDIDAFTVNELTADFENEVDKVRAIFTWITANIRYDLNKFMNPEPINIRAASFEEALEKKALIDEKNIAITLRRKKGICGDYSALFKRMCEAIDIEAEIVPGYSRNIIEEPSIGGQPDHAWNAFKVGDQWYLVDATWGSGHVSSDAGKFVQRFIDFYFMTDPADMIQSHYPVDSRWQLMDNPMSPDIFLEQPLFFPLYREMRLSDVLPQKQKLNNRKVAFSLSGPSVDPKKVVVIQNGQIQKPIFTKRGESVHGTVDLNRSSKKVYLGYMVTSTRAEPLVSFKL